MSSERERLMLRHERKIWREGVSIVAGVDEAGRGSLAGPVVAAAVVFSPGTFIPDVDDSKVLRPVRREELFEVIMETANGVGIGVVDHSEIDRINILQATFQAMRQAIGQLGALPGHVLIDGNRFSWNDENGQPAGSLPFTTIVDGDARSHSVAAASIVAKVARDRMMVEFDSVYPAYGFARNKGYATPAHREAIYRHGFCPIHRRSFVLHSQLELSLR